MKLVVFGLTITSSWGNGHATLWRGLCKALARSHHHTVFFERDVPYYAGARDCAEVPGGRLVLYSEWAEVRRQAEHELRDCDAAIVTSYCPDGIAAGELMREQGRAVTVFYDLDTPVTLARIANGESIPYIGTDGLRGFDLVLSYTGGGALDALRRELGARRVAPLYGHVDPEQHRPATPQPQYRADLSYLGTYAADRQATVDTLFMEPARRRPQYRFLLGGALYPSDYPWSSNIYFVRHLPPGEHPAFYCSGRLTLNVTRAAMARSGWCPSGRLFEAAACGAPIATDSWAGLDSFFAPGVEVIAIASTEEALDALDMDDAELARIGRAARERALAEHTSAHRARDLVAALEAAAADSGAAALMEA